MSTITTLMLASLAVGIPLATGFNSKFSPEKAAYSSGSGEAGYWSSPDAKYVRADDLSDALYKEHTPMLIYDTSAYSFTNAIQRRDEEVDCP
ncbi:hypothetical protein DSO57_1036340 [Entomophthora muscae]|uniref:Uncharacterized protein n=1 Tax=Entomophthora muscae TaxID=34485 RepID=A0ACC2TL84_9FUNG|nr:hypothetical protein DSO57_1036340 [Entomophthora muscae]